MNAIYKNYICDDNIYIVDEKGESMNIRQFRYILAVEDHKNFELAAEACFVSQSTLSTMIGRFETEIGIKVFDRKAKPVVLTAEGRELLDRLRIVVNEVDSLNNLVQELKGEMAGTLSIGVIPTIAPYVLPRILPEFGAMFPGVEVLVKEMTTNQIRSALNRRQLDIGMLALPIHDPKMDEHPLYREPFVVFDCTGESNRDSLNLEDLDYSKLYLLQEGHCLRTQVQAICELSNSLAENTVNYRFESGSMDSLLRITKAGGGMTILPHLATHELPKVDQQRLVPFKEPVPMREIGLLTPKFFAKKQLLWTLRQIIKETIEPLLPEDSQGHVLDPV